MTFFQIALSRCHQFKFFIVTAVLHFRRGFSSCLTGNDQLRKEVALDLMADLLLPLAKICHSRVEAEAYHSMSDKTPNLYCRNTVKRKSL